VTWLTSFSDARAAAKKSGKPVMINFTGKAWSGRCKVLKKEVFDTAKFKQWATDNVVLLELDFPQSGTSAENRKLQGLYQVRGFPMIIFINAEGAIYGKMGRVRGGPDSWLSTAKRALANTNPTAVAGLSTGSGSNPPKNPGNLAGPKLKWLTSYTAAIAESKKSGKPVMINFTKKNWSIRCIKLREEVFSKAEFKRWASDKVVLLELDFPRSGATATAKSLASKYGVKSYPTIMFINAEGEILGKTGYVHGGPSKWLGGANISLANKSPKAPTGGSSLSGNTIGGFAPGPPVKKPKPKRKPKPKKKLDPAAQEKAAAALMRFAEGQLKKNRTSQAIKWLERILQRYPNTEVAKEAMKILETIK